MNCLVPVQGAVPAAAMACLLAAVGCGNPNQIRSYTVEKSVPQDRMLGAIIPRGERAWFFKVTGPNQPLGELADAFSAFIQTVRFAGEEPTWELPDGWVREPGSSMRFATIRMPVEDELLELSVTVLPAMADTDRLVLDNINRWRGQLQLAAITSQQLGDESDQLQLDAASGLTATLVNMVGNLEGGGMRAAPLAGGGSPPAGPFAGSAPPSAPASIEYETPEGWQPGQRVRSRGGISITYDAAFEVVDGQQRIEITVSKLPAMPQTLLSNIRRWRGQTGLEPLGDEQQLDELEPIDVGGLEGSYVELVGPQQTILGVVAVDQAVAWFVKLTGDQDLALRERERFRQFVESIQFQNQ